MVFGITVMVLSALAFVLAYVSYKGGEGIAFIWLLLIGTFMALCGATEIDEAIESDSAERSHDQSTVGH